MNAGRFLKKSVPAFGQVNKKVIARSYVSKTLIRSGGAPHGDAHGDGHDDGHHHAHPLWEYGSRGAFDKTTVGLFVWGALFGGVSLIWGACVFQNKKHGFPQSK